MEPVCRRLSSHVCVDFGSTPAKRNVGDYVLASSRSTIGGGRGCHKFVPVFGGDGTKTARTGDIFDQPPGKTSPIRGKLADHVGDHVVLSPEGSVLVTSPGTESSYPRPPHSLNDSVF